MRGWMLVPVGLLYLLLLTQLGQRDLWSSHEARAAQNAQRMLDEGDWTLPRLFDDRPDLQKPPLFYWLVAVVGWLRGGVDAVAVRLPAYLAALATLLLLGGYLHRRGRPLAAWLAVTILATMQHFTWLAQVGRIDMPLTATITLAVLALVERRTGLAAVALAMALLLKGPIGVALPLAAAAMWVAWRAHADGRRSLVIAPILAVIVAAPWFVVANVRTEGEFFRVFFWYHNVQRALGGTEALEEHPWWFYGPRFLVDAAPWSLVFLGVGVLATRRLEPDREARLGLVWFAAMVLLLSLARFKRADYLLPALPGMALFLGCTLERWLARLRPVARRWALQAHRGCLVLCLLAWGGFLFAVQPWQDAQYEQQTFAAAIRELVPPPKKVLFFRCECHDLAFHLGRPINTFLEWENLNVWAGKPRSHYVLMPLPFAREWSQHVTAGQLEEVLRGPLPPDGAPERTLVLMRTTRTEPRTESCPPTPKPPPPATANPRE